MKKFIGNFLGLVLLAALVLPFVFKDKLVTEGLMKGLTATTELTPEIGSVNVDVMKGTIFVKDLKLFNAGSFKDQVLLEVPELEIDYHLTSLLKGKLHSQKVALEVAKVFVIRNQTGELNLNALKGVNVAENTPEEEILNTATASSTSGDIQIDRIRLHILEVDFYDETTGESQIIPAGLVRNFKDITDPHTIIKMIVSEVITQTSLNEMFLSDVGSLAEEASEEEMILGEDKAQKALQNTVENWKGAIKQIPIGK